MTDGIQQSGNRHPAVAVYLDEVYFSVNRRIF